MGDGYVEGRYPNRVKELRLEHDPPWSASQLARAAGLNKAQVSRIERGLWVPRDVTQQKIARALGLDRGDVFPQTVDA